MMSLVYRFYVPNGDHFITTLKLIGSKICYCLTKFYLTLGEESLDRQLVGSLVQSKCRSYLNL